MTGLRELNKSRRRAAVLDAAVTLLQGQPLEAVTTEQIAAHAQVAVATVYNLVGTRDQLWRALIARLLDDVVGDLARHVETGSHDPLAALRLVVDRSVLAFTAESACYRQVVGALAQQGTSSTVLDLDPAMLQTAGVRHAQQQGVLRTDVPAGSIGRQIYLSYLGSLIAWSGGGLTDASFAIAARHGLLSTLVAYAEDGHRELLLTELLAVSRELGNHPWSS